MKILFLVKFYQPFDRGGSEWSTHDLAKLLVDKGHLVTIVTPNYGAQTHEVIGKIKIHRLPFPIKLKNPKSKIAPFWTNNILWFFYSFIFVLYFSIRNRIEVIHIHSNEFIPGATLAGMITKTPTVVTFRDYQAICPLGFCLWHRNKACNIKTYVSDDFNFFYQNYVNRKSRLVYLLLLVASIRAKAMQAVIKYFSKRINLKVAVSKKVQKIFTENGLADLEVIHNPILVNGQKNDSSNTILYVGKFSKGKGIDLLVEAIPEVLKSLKMSHFKLIGAGNLEDEIKKKIDRYNLGKKVKLTGQLSHQETLSQIKRAGLVVVPSVWQEPLPRSAIESLLLSTPVVATNVGGIEEVIKDNTYGILTDPRSDELGKSIIKAFKNKKRLKTNILKDMDVLKKHFSKDCVNSYLKVYRSFLL